mmetsp:Transcript_52232/g.124535  ORF Transcript_52232/g.124535 Transcript_52232/m.124535 type:complete len:209 (-) Transcript_52232:314-940(-)
MSNMRVVVKSPIFTTPCWSRNTLSGFRFRCMMPWWCICDSPVSSWRNLLRISPSRCTTGLSCILLITEVKFSCTNSTHIEASFPLTSASKYLTTLGCRIFDNSAASRRKEVGTPSSLPAFVNSRLTVRSSTASPVPRRLQRKSLPLDRLSTSLSAKSSCSESFRCLRSPVHSSLLCATSHHALHVGAALATMSFAPSRQKIFCKALLL